MPSMQVKTTSRPSNLVGKIVCAMFDHQWRVVSWYGREHGFKAKMRECKRCKEKIMMTPRDQ